MLNSLSYNILKFLFSVYLFINDLARSGVVNYFKVKLNFVVHQHS